MIVSYDSSRNIGKDGDLLIKIPNDLNRFRQRTLGCTIVMGRKTFESLPGVLPHRNHWVITRDKDYDPKYDSDKVRIFHSKEEVIAEANRLGLANIYIIGGGQIYEEFMDVCDCIYATIINRKLDGDTKFPKIKSKEWSQVQDGKTYTWSDNGIQYTYNFINFYRKKEATMKFASKYNKVL